MNSWYLALSPDAFTAETEYRNEKLRRVWSLSRGFRFPRGR
jgi:hypothetical protein